MEPRTIRISDISFRVRSDEHQRFWTKIESGQWEPETYPIFQRFVTKDTTVLDVGCWEGPTLLYAAGLAKMVHGFEPDPVAFAGLQRNVDANPEMQNVRVHHQCVADKTGEVQFGSAQSGGDTMSSMLLSGGKTVWTIPSIRLDEFVAREGLQAPLFVKMDTEGGEYSIVPTLHPFFCQYRPTLYLSTHPGAFGQAAPGLLSKLRAHFSLIYALRGFPFIYDGNGRRVRLWELLLKKKWRENSSIVATYQSWEK